MAADRFPPQTARLLQLLRVIEVDHGFSPLTSPPLRRRCPTQLLRQLRR